MLRDELRENMKELAAGYVLGNLSPEEAETLRSYTSEHPEFAIEIDRLDDVLGVLPYGLPDRAPPPELRDQLLAALPEWVAVPNSDANSANADRANVPQTDSPQPDFHQPDFHQGERPKSTLRVINWRWSNAARQPWLAPVAACVALTLGLTTWQTQRTLLEARSELLATRDRVDKLEVALDRATARDLPVLEPDAALASTWQLDRLVEDHRRAIKSASTSQSVANATDMEVNEIVSAFRDRFEFAPSLPVLNAPSVRLVGGTFCRLGNTAGFRFTYQTEDGLSLSLYQIGTPDDTLALPETSDGHLHIRQAGQPEILLWSKGGFDYALVAEDMSGDRMAEFSDMRYEIVSQ